VLESNSFVVRERASRLTSRKVFDIHDGETGELLGTATRCAGWLGSALGLLLGKKSVPTVTEVRERLDDSLVFSVHRSGILAGRIEVQDSQGELVGTFRAKTFSLGGGFAIHDSAGNHFGDVRGKLLTSDLVVVTPDGKAELGRVTRQWGGLLKELFTNSQAYGVQVNPDFTEHPIAKMLILGSALAADDVLSRS
jgi:uncharacterized protein YxjI